jgi:hypothetical protein
MGDLIHVDFARRQMPDAAVFPMWWWLLGAACMAGFCLAAFGGGHDKAHRRAAG